MRAGHKNFRDQHAKFQLFRSKIVDFSLIAKFLPFLKKISIANLTHFPWLCPHETGAKSWETKKNLIKKNNTPKFFTASMRKMQKTTFLWSQKIFENFGKFLNFSEIYGNSFREPKYHRNWTSFAIFSIFPIFKPQNG